MAEITHYFSKLPDVVKQSEIGKCSASHVRLCWGGTESAFGTEEMSKYNR